MDRTLPPSVSFEQFSADRLNRDREQITRDWVDRLSSQLGVRPRRVLPTEDLLDGVPPVLSKAAEFLVIPGEEKITAQNFITDQMREIARLRCRQGYDVQELIRELDELAELLDGAALHWIDEFEGTPDPKAVGRVFGRLNRAPLLMGQITVGVFREEEMKSRHTTARWLRRSTETLMHQLRARDEPAFRGYGRAWMHRMYPTLCGRSLNRSFHPRCRSLRAADPGFPP